MYDTLSKGHRSASPLQRYGDQLGRIVERRLTEQALVAARQKAERSADAARCALLNAEAANRAKTTFLANMSHELRTPLNAIIGFSDIIQQQLLGPQGQDRYVEYARDINGAGTHLLAIINDILNIAKIEAGQLDLEETAFKVDANIDDCLKMLSDQVQSAGLQLRREFAGSLPPLWGDEKKFRQILLNLLSNSIKFTGSGGTVALGAGIAPNGALRVTVRDTGIGIAPEDLDRVVEPFSQVDSALSRKYQGTGLGLSISKAFVELHGGSLKLESEPGVGTSITLHFPAERVR